jgi:hypothetical protein
MPVHIALLLINASVQAPKPVMPSLDWTMLSALATLATAVIVFIGLGFTYKQVRQASKAQQMEAALTVLGYIDSPALREARRFLFSHKLSARLEIFAARDPEIKTIVEDFDKSFGSKPGFEALHSYLASLEHLSILTMNGLAQGKIIEMYFGRIVPHHWATLYPLTRHLRLCYGTDDFLQHFEMLNALITSCTLGRGGLIGFFTQWKRHRILADRRKQRRIAKDYVLELLPDPDSQRWLIDVSRRISEVARSKTLLDAKLALPHVSIYVAAFPVAAEASLIELARRRSAKLDPITIQVNHVRISSDGLVMLEFNATKELSELHDEIITAANPLRTGAVSAVWAKHLGELNPQQVDLLNEIGYPYGRELWQPHFTVGKISPGVAAKVELALKDLSQQLRLNFLAVGTVGTDGRMTSELVRYLLSPRIMTEVATPEEFAQI